MLKKLFGLLLTAAIWAGCEDENSNESKNPFFSEWNGKTEEVFTLHRHFFEVPASGGMITVEVMSNIEYAVTIPEAFRTWITAIPKSRAVTSAGYRFSVAENTELESREGYVVFVGDSLADTIYVQQAATVEVIKDFTETVAGVSFDMVYVQGGTFMMGATEEDESARDEEKPIHQVTLSSYYIGKYEVTQGLWEAVMGNNPSGFKKGDNYPVEKICWDDAQTFIAKLNQLTGKHYALPTEAQWEYAARGGAKSRGYKYSGSDVLEDVAWYNELTGSTHPVGTKQPNELGLYDMSGNVFEWCSDWFDFEYYAVSPENNPTGPESGTQRVLRGGSWFNYDWYSRVSQRDYYSPKYQDHDFGFRIVLLP